MARTKKFLRMERVVKGEGNSLIYSALFGLLSGFTDWRFI
jgi:hypothetical protein